MCFKYSVCNQEVGRELGICSLRHSQQEFQLAFTSVCGFYNNQRLAFVIVGDLFSVTGINRIRMRKLHRTFFNIYFDTDYIPSGIKRAVRETGG